MELDFTNANVMLRNKDNYVFYTNKEGKLKIEHKGYGIKRLIYHWAGSDRYNLVEIARTFEIRLSKTKLNKPEFTEIENNTKSQLVRLLNEKIEKHNKNHPLTKITLVKDSFMTAEQRDMQAVFQSIYPKSG